MADRSLYPAAFKDLDRTHDELKAARLDREAEWQMIADVFLPRKNFTLPLQPTQLRRRRLTSSVPGIALERGTALLVAHAIDPTRPFIGASAARGMVAAGRPTDLDPGALDYLSDLEWSIRDRMMLPKAGFLTTTARAFTEYGAFGTGIGWTVRKRGFGPVYQSLPLRACWIAEDEDGIVDTLYFQFTLPIWRAVARWPNHGVEKWTEAMASEDASKAKALVTVVRAVYPRLGGTYGAVRASKPFAEVYFCCAEKAILEEGGYDTFPASVPRLNVESGSCYGTGWAWKALPEALVLNALQASVERSVELRNDPPVMVPKRLFGKALDRRAGAVNYYDGSGLGFQNANQAIQTLNLAGDTAIAADYMRRLEQNVEQAFFVDWMRLRETGTMTAEEVRERRNMRIGAMSAIVPGLDREYMGPMADRTLEIQQAEGELPPPPAALSGIDVDWEYKGPLAIAQLRQQAESVGQLFAVAVQAKEIDPSAVYAIAVDEALREVAEALAVPPRTLRSREDVAQARQRDAMAKELSQNAELAQQAGAALRDGGQGAVSLSTLAGGAGPGDQPVAPQLRQAA